MSILTDLKDLLFPRLCLACGTRLHPSEDMLCTSCHFKLPHTRLLHTPGNEIEKLFWGHFPIERASALLYYSRAGEVAHVLAHMKYHGRKDVCLKMGEMMADELEGTDFFEGVDCLIPVPLHPERLRKRGYNQSEWLARGIASRNEIPVCTDVLYRLRNNQTQTHKTAFERRTNTEGLFGLTPQSDRLIHRHVMLIDDVLTTGATLEACGEALSVIEGIRISILTLAWTR